MAFAKVANPNAPAHLDPTIVSSERRINMLKDEVNEKNKDEIIEILIENMWIPAMATDLRIMNKDNDLVRVEAIRVRKLKI